MSFQLSPKELNDKLNSLDKEISQYAGPGEENPKRASKLYDQMNSTWRVASDSKEFDAAKKAMQDKPIDPRDIAMLTALKNLQAKCKNGENLVVEHEALCAELEKVQKDKRFSDAMKTKSREELIEMAWGGNFDTLDGYSKPMTPEQQERVKAEKERIAREDPKNQFENAKKAFKEKAEAEKEINNKDYISNNRPTFEAIDKAEKEAEEFRKNHRSLKELCNDVLPQVKEMGNPLNSAFSAIEDQAAQDAETELFAKMIAIGEYQDKLTSNKDISHEDMQVDLKEFNERVDTLKKDPFVVEMAKGMYDDVVKKNKTVQEKKNEQPNKGMGMK